MGLNFKILVIWKALSTMSGKVSISATGVKPGGFGSAGSKAAPVAAPVAAPSAAPSAAPKAAPKECFEFRESGNPCSRNNCRDATCRNAKARVQHTASPKHSAPPKAAGGGDGGISAHITAMEARITSHIDLRFQAAEASINSGFLQLNGAVAQSQLATQQSFQGLANAMATAFSGGQRQLPPPERRQIGNGAEEVVEPARQQISYGQNSGWCQPVEGSDRFTTSSSQRLQIGAACGGGAANDSSRFFSHRETPTEFRGSSGGSTLVAARQLGMNHRYLAKFEANFAKMKSNDFNNFVGAAIRNFVANFPQNEQDEMACVLLGMVNGKKYPAHNSIIIESNESVFRRFFGELAMKFPNNALKTTNTRGQELTIPFKTLSADSSAMFTLIRVLRGEE